MDRVQAAPTLIIGLGGTGALAVQFAMKKMRQILQTLGEDPHATLPFVSYLVIDANARQEEVEEKLTHQFINMGHKNMTRALQSLDPHKRQTVLGWFTQPDPGQVESGARGVRSLGRLCFFISKPSITEELTQRVHEIGNPDAYASKMPGAISLVPGTIDVHIISSLCGGTGSSCLLDMTYLVRHVIDEVLRLQASPVAHLVTCDSIEGEPNTDAAMLRSNMLLTLAEIEHFSRGRWDVEYLDGTRITAPQTKPFTLTYLLGAPDSASTTRRSVCERIGEMIAVSTLSPENGIMRRPLANVIQVVNERHAGDERRWYSSYGIRLLSARMDPWVKRAATEAAIDAVTERLIGSNSRTADDWRAFERLVTQTFNTNPIATEIHAAAVKELTANLGSLADLAYQVTRRGLTQRAAGTQGLVLRAAELEEERLLYEAETRAEDIGRKYKALYTSLANHAYEVFKANGVTAADAFLGRVLGWIDELTATVPWPAVSIAFIDAVKTLLTGGSEATFQRDAPERLESAAHRKVYERVRTELLGLHDKVNNLLASVRSAKIASEDWRNESRRRITSADGEATQSIWDRQSAFDEMTDSASESKLQSEFLRRMVARSGRDDVTLLERLADAGSRTASAQVLLDVAEDYVADLDQRPLDYGPSGTKVTHGAFGTHGLESIVHAAEPMWQLDRAGDNIRRLMLTNCPQQSAVGEELSGLAKKLVEFPSAPSAASRSLLWLMVSEHGVSLKQLSRISDCIAAVRDRLRAEGKHSVNDLALDPRWQIADPVDIDTTKLVLFFSLGCMLDRIHTSRVRIWLGGTYGDAVLDLASSPNALDRVRRYDAFYRFCDLLKAQNETVVKLRHNIQDDLTRQQENSGATALMRDRLKNHITTLDEQVNAADATERQWLEGEIQILKNFIRGL